MSADSFRMRRQQSGHSRNQALHLQERLASASQTIPDNKKGKPARLIELQAAAVTDSGVLLVNRELGRF
jgi:hypothetical protein